MTFDFCSPPGCKWRSGPSELYNIYTRVCVRERKRRECAKQRRRFVLYKSERQWKMARSDEVPTFASAARARRNFEDGRSLLRASLYIPIPTSAFFFLSRRAYNEKWSAASLLLCVDVASWYTGMNVRRAFVRSRANGFFLFRRWEEARG